MDFPLARLIFLSVIASGFILIETSEKSEVVCPIESGDPNETLTLLPNPKNCSTFFICDHGNPVEMNCPADTLFDPTILVCNDKHNVTCEISNLLPDLTPCNETDGLVLLPNPYDCSTYVICDPDSWSFGFLENCPEGLQFNPEISVCDYPENFNCTVEEL